MESRYAAEAMLGACESAVQQEGETKGVTTMATKRKAWMIKPAMKPTATVSDALKREVEPKASDLIANFLKPQHVRPPQEDDHFNYITDIGAKWNRHYFYFFSTYACPAPNALSPTFEEKFARLEYIGDAKFCLCFMRHTGEWVGIHDALSVDEAMTAIQDDPWFTP